MISFVIFPSNKDIMRAFSIPRYEMLLKELCKHTWADHPDREGLEGAYVFYFLL